MQLHRKLLLLLTLSICSTSLSAERLIYGEYDAPQSDPLLYKATTDIAKRLFEASQYRLQIKSVPYGARVVSEFQMKNLDILITGSSKDLSMSIPTGVIETHPIPITDFSWNFFVRDDSGLTSSASNSLKDYHLGAARLPVSVLSTLLGQDTKEVTFYANYDYLSKGLIANRFDIMTGNKKMSQRAFSRLGVSHSVINIGHAFTLKAHVLVRASLPVQTKQSIFKILDQRIPELKSQGVIDKILEQHGWY
jgi:hypothetical protein